jgi:hypothetical protein
MRPGEVFDLPDVKLNLLHVASEPGEHYTVSTLR